MNANAIQNIITNAISDYSGAMFIVLGAIITVIIGFFVFRSGVKWLKKEDGMTIADRNFKRINEKYGEW